MSDLVDPVDPVDSGESGFVAAVPTYVTRANDWDVLMFDGAGNRLPLSRNEVVSLEFTYGENAGYESGTLELVRRWSPSVLTNLERVDVYGFGQSVPIFRGWARTIENNMDASETIRLTLYGLQQRLTKWICRRNYCYGGFVDPGTVFTDIAIAYVNKAERLSDLSFDLTGVSELGLLLQELDCQGKTVAQAYNDLCSMFPNTLIWGFDVDASGIDRLYLRPRATSPKYAFTVGKNVQAITYPRDATPIVNRVFLTGKKLDYPNLLYNASFELTVVPSETTNMLNNPGFEDADEAVFSGQFALNWGHQYSATRFDGSTYTDSYGSPHNGSAYVGLDDSGSGSPEAVWQTVCLPGAVLPTMHATVWGRQIRTGDTHGFYIILYVQDVTQTNVATYMSPLCVPPTDTSYEKFSVNWTVPAGTTGAVFCGVRFQSDGSGSTDHGVFIDDAAFWIDEPLLDGWRVAPQSNAYFAILDWVYPNLPAFDGDNMVHVKAGFPSGAPSGSYAEICTSQDHRLQVNARAYYTVSFWVQPVQSVVVALGARLYKSDGTLDSIQVASQTTIAASTTWTQVSMWIETGPNVAAMEPFFRFYNTGECFIDAAAVMEGPPPNPYQAGDTWQGIVETSQYTGAEIGAEAAASQTTWGDCEASESDPNVIDATTAHAWGLQYFRANAVRETSGTLTITDPDTYVGLLDGQIRLINVSAAEDPGPLTPARVRYRFAERTTIDIDLNNLRSDMGQLLRLVAQNLI